MKSLVLQVNYWWLWDNLFYSHIPRIAKQFWWYEKVFISNNIPYRNPIYKDLIWSANPFVDWFVDDQWINVDSHIKTNIQWMNLLDQIMLAYWLDDVKRFHEPEIYLDFAIIKKYHWKNIYDPNYISFVWYLNPQLVKKWFSKNNIKIDYVLKSRNKNSIDIDFDYPVEYIETQNIDDYCSLIKSCGSFFCMGSWWATLSAWLWKKAHVFYWYLFNKKFRHSKVCTYIYIKPNSFLFVISRIIINKMKILMKVC